MSNYNNVLSRVFNVKKGVRQGDPVSPTTFVLRQSKEYQGFKINNHCFKVSLFANDTVIYLYGNATHFNILNDFCKKSRCQVN